MNQHNMFDELNNRFRESYNVKCFWRVVYRGVFRSRGVFRTQANIYHGAFLGMYLTAYYFHNKSSIIDVRLGYI